MSTAKQTHNIVAALSVTLLTCSACCAQETIKVEATHTESLKMEATFAPASAPAINSGELHAFYDTAVTSQELCEGGETGEENVNNKIEAYRKKNGIRNGKNEKGDRFYVATVTIDAKRGAPDWSQKRILAFESALLKAQTEFLKEHFGNLTMELNQRLSAESTRNGTEISAKARADMRKKALVQSSGAISALAVVSSCVGYGKSGNDDAVGIVLVYSERWQRVAQAMKEKVCLRFTGNPKKNIYTLLDKENIELCEMFGCRIGFDEEGQPVVLAFGQWVSPYTGSDPKIISLYAKSASSQAALQADSMLTAFQELSMGSIEESELEKKLDTVINNNVEKINIDSVAERLVSNVRQIGRSDMLGRATARNWSYRTPQGQRIYGVVRAWSLSGRKQAEETRSVLRDQSSFAAPQVQTTSDNGQSSTDF